MTYEQTLDAIHSFGRMRGGAGLHRILHMLNLMGNPHLGMRAIHIGGTNGKGSTTTLISSALTSWGCKTGSYTSPFVMEFRERIRIDGEMIPKDDLAALTEELLPLAEQTAGELGESLNEFEFTTALAFCYFARQGCQMVVLEVGLGGRFDATNVIPKPLVTVLTPIGLDHTEILGNTVERIAWEKCGIIKKGVPTVVSPCQCDEALAVIFETCAEEQSPVVMPSLAAVSDVSLTMEGTSFSYGSKKYDLALLGEYQLSNAITAIEALAALGVIAPYYESVRCGFASAFLPARMEVICKSPLILLDGAHNPHGTSALASALESLGCTNFTAVTGMLCEKDWHKAMNIMLPLCRSVITLTPPSPRALDADVLAEWIAEQGIPARAAHSPTEALEAALECADGGAIVIFGSLYLAGDMRREVQKRLNRS